MISQEQISLLDTTMLLRSNIRQAIKDYGAHTDAVSVLNDVSEEFINQLAEDATASKKNLRELLRKSPAWNENLQAVIINGTRTHDPDYSRVYRLGMEIFLPWLDDNSGYKYRELASSAVRFFSESEASSYELDSYIKSIKILSPKAYRANRKKSRIFKAMCDTLGITDETAGSDFSRLFAQFADELSGKKLDFKLFLSINPAHFITMSNPKCDNRGEMLTSCHSFNRTDYNYNNGCTGYARDNVTMIAFTVDNPDIPELLNNRKTTRQLFMYKVGNGLLLQSRMYNSSGGVYGTSSITPLYRDLVQRELAELEGLPNRWKTYTYCKDKPENICIGTEHGFGGYADWIHSNFDAKISIRLDHIDDCKNFNVGNSGLFICCGQKITRGLYCPNCGESCVCDCCGEHFDEDDLYLVHDGYGNEIQVCSDCRDANYTYCSHCEGYYPDNTMTCINGDYICRQCLEDDYSTCNDCGDVHLTEDMHCVTDENGNEVWVCDDCYDNYDVCNVCGNVVHVDSLVTVHNRNGNEIQVCEECCNNLYEYCDVCGEYYHKSVMENGLCPRCRAEDNNAEELA